MPQKRRAGFVLAAVTIGALVVAATGASTRTRVELGAAPQATGAPSGAVDTKAWAPADPAYRLSLPRDHGSHPQHRIEWWYYTGNVDDEAGRRFGYQLTFFRVGVDRAPVNPSRWAVRDLFMAHFAIIDAGGQRYRASDRLSRTGVGWAGARGDTLGVWIDDWSARLGPGGEHVLRATDADMAIELSLEPGKAFVAHGRNGYSQKGSAPGNASHYYSLTRMPTRGTIAFGGRSYRVAGESWMDHEFGSSFLEAGQQGWDWFSIQLDDRSELMLFQIRNAGADDGPAGGVGADGERPALPAQVNGTLVDPVGRVVALSAADVRMIAGREWRSPTSGARYPVAWRIEIPAHGLTLDVRAAMDAQELHTASSTNVTYWEGAIDVTGTRAGRPVRGRGYLELTGYTGAAMSDVLR